MVSNEQKAYMLAKEIGIDVEKIELPKRYRCLVYTKCEYKTPKGTYLVMNEDEANGIYKEDLLKVLAEANWDIRQLFKEDYWYLCHNCLNEDRLYPYMREEIGEKFYEKLGTSEIIEEASGYGLLDDELEDKISEYENKNDTNNLDRIANGLRGTLVEAECDDFYSIIDYFKETIGKDKFIDIYVKGNPNIINIDKLVHKCRDLYGYKPLAVYDGEVLELDDLYIIQQDDDDNRSDEFMTSLR